MSMRNVTFDPVRDPLIRDHQLNGVPLVPATVLLESCAQAAGELLGVSAFTSIEGFELFRGIRFYNAQPQTVRVTVEPVSDGRIHCEIRGDFFDQRTQVISPDELYAECWLKAEPVSLRPHVSAKTDGDWAKLVRGGEPAAFDREHMGTVFHGASLATLTGISPVTDSLCLFKIDRAAAGGDEHSEILSPVILDTVLQACDVHCTRQFGTQQLPTGWKRMLIDCLEMEQASEFVAMVQLQQRGDVGAVYDVQLVSAEGHTVAEWESIQLATRRQHRSK